MVWELSFHEFSKRELLLELKRWFWIKAILELGIASGLWEKGREWFLEKREDGCWEKKKISG